MQPHPDANSFILKPGVAAKLTLSFGSTLDSIQGPAERDEEGIPLRIHFCALPFLDGSAQNAMMLLQRDGILVTQLVEQACRSLDIREKKGDRAGRVGRQDSPWDFGALKQAIKEGMRLGRRLDAEVVLQILDTALVDGADLRHIAAGVVRKHQGAVGSLGDKTERQPALTLLLHGCPALCLHQLFDELSHSRFKQGLQAFTLEHHPVIVETRQKLALIDRKPGGKRLDIRVRVLQDGDIQPVIGASVKS